MALNIAKANTKIVNKNFLFEEEHGQTWGK